jgi:hypothetical protein
MGRRGVLGVVVAAVVGGMLLAACGDEPKAQSAGAAGSGLVAPGAFTTDGSPPPEGGPTARPAEDPAAIIAGLWTRRQAGMLTEDAAVFRKLDAGPLAAHDLSIARLVACGCDVPRHQSPLQRVVLLRSRKPTPGVLLAEVFTDTPDGTFRFLVVAEKVKRVWRLAFVTEDTYDTAGVRTFIDGRATAPATTASDRRAGAAILRREVAELLRWSKTGQAMSTIFTGKALGSHLDQGRPNANRGTTDYGAPMVATTELHKQDPIFTFRLDRKRVITCGAWHSPVTTFAPPGQVLVQPPNRHGWGPDLRPGSYASVTLDQQTLTCILDHGTGATRRYEGIGDYHATITTTGRRGA